MTRARTQTGASARNSAADRVLLLLFGAYKRFVGPPLHALSFVQGGCGFQPTCSEYATLALAQHGVLRGGAMALWRVLRCNPFHRGGWDPVPAARKRSAGV